MVAKFGLMFFFIKGSLDPVGKNWTGRCGNHDKTKKVEMDWPYLEEREGEHH